MKISPLSTPLLKAGDDLSAALLKSKQIGHQDIVVISSKVIAVTEGQSTNLADITPSKEAAELAKTCHQDPRFTELILRETKRMNGAVAGESRFAILTELRPTGMKTGRILCPNAGMDLSNAGSGVAVGWPKDPVKSALELKKKLGCLGVIVSDSCCTAGRLGVTAFALVAAGCDPLKSEVGAKDLFGASLRVTFEAVADQLAVAGNAVMGNAAQSIPAAIITDHGLPPTSFAGWVDGMNEEDDLFQSLFKK